MPRIHLIPTFYTLAGLALAGFALPGGGLMAADTKGYVYGHYQFGDNNSEQLNTLPGDWTGTPRLQEVYRKDGHLVGVWYDQDSFVSSNKFSRWVIARRLSDGTWENLGAPNLIVDGVTIDSTQLPTQNFDIIPANGVSGELEIFLTFYNFNQNTGNGPGALAVKWSGGTWTAPFGAAFRSGVWSADQTPGATNVVGMQAAAAQTPRAKIISASGVTTDIHGLLDTTPARFFSSADRKRGTRIFGISAISQAAADAEQITGWIYDSSTGFTTDIPVQPSTLSFPSAPSVAVNWDEWTFFVGAGLPIVIQAQGDVNDERHAAFIWDPASPNDFTKRFLPLNVGDNRVEIDSVNFSGTRFGGQSFVDGAGSNPTLWTAYNVTPIDVRTELHSDANVNFENISDVNDDGMLITSWGSAGVLIPLATVSLTSSDTVLAEDGAGAKITVSRTGPTLLPLSVGLNFSGTGSGDVLANSGLWNSEYNDITIPAGASSITFPLEAINDSVAETESVTVTLRAARDTDDMLQSELRDAGDARWTYNIGGSNFADSFTILDPEDDIAPPAKTNFSIMSLPLPPGVGTLTDNTWMGPEAISPNGQWILFGVENNNIRRWYRYSVMTNTWTNLGITIAGYDGMELDAISNAGTVVGSAYLNNIDPMIDEWSKVVPVRALAGFGCIQLGTAEGELSRITEDNALWGGHHATLPGDYAEYTTFRSATWASGSTSPTTLFTTGLLAGRPSFVNQVAGSFIGGGFITVDNKPGLYRASLPSTLLQIPLPTSLAANPKYSDVMGHWDCEGLLSTGEGVYSVGIDDDPTAPIVSFRSDGVTSTTFFSPNSDGNIRNNVEVRDFAQPGPRKMAVGNAYFDNGNDRNDYHVWIWEDTMGRPDLLSTRVSNDVQGNIFGSVGGLSASTGQIITDGWDVNDTGFYNASKKRIQLLTPRPMVDLSDVVTTIAENAAGTVTVTVTRSSPGNGTLPWALDVSVVFSGNSTKDDDYTVTGGSVISQTATTAIVRIPAASTSTTFVIDPSDDGAIESSETVVVTVDAPTDRFMTTDTYDVGTTSSFTMTSEDTGIATAIATTGPNPTRTTIPVTVTFGSSVTGFADGDVTVVSGTPGTISGSGTTYTLTVTPTITDGVVQISIAGGVAVNGATPNAPASTLNVTVDTTAAPIPSAPDLASGSDLGVSNDDDITNVTMPTVTGMVGGDAVAVNLYEGGTLLGTDATIVAGAWSIPSSALAGQGNHTLTAKSVDPVGNESAASAGLTIVLDTVRPTVTTSINPPVGATANAFTGTITWSEDVSPSFAVGDVMLAANTTAGGAMTGGPLMYSLPLTATAQGSLGFSIGAAAAVTDVAGNAQNTGAGVISATFTPAPFPTISLNGGTDPTRFSPILLRVTFSEPVAGFDPATEIGVTGGILANFVETTTNLVWTFELTPTGQGTDTLNIAAGVATATVGGLANIAATTFTVLYDSAAPSAPGVPDMDIASDSGSSNIDDITNVQMPTFTGPAEAGATVILSSSIDGLIGQAVATGVSWTTVATANMSAGVHTMTATATDPAGNVSPASMGLSLTIDVTQPTVTFTAPTTPTNDDTVALAGTNEPGAVISIFEGTTNHGSATVVTGNWTFTTPDLADGSHTLFARATDTAGNTANSASRSVTVDTTPPAVPIALDLAVGSDTGANSTDNLTNDTTPTITGSAPATTLVHLFSDGTPVGSVTSTAGGTWSITSSSALAEGSRDLTAKTEDALGNQSAASAILTIIIDTTAPAVVPSVLDLANASDSGINSDNLTNIVTPTITGVGTTGDTIRLYDGGTLRGSATAAGGTWSINASSLADGLRALMARAEDAAGNQTADSAPFSITIDTAAPVAPSALDLVAGSDSGTTTDNITNDTTPTINGAAESAATVQLFSGATLVGSGTAAAGAWSITTSTTLSEGVNNMTAVATDVAGNVSSASTPVFAVTIDTVAPTLTLGAPTLPGAQAAVRAGQTVTVVATYADVGGSGIGSITLADANITLGGSTVGATAVVSGAGLVTRTITATAGTGVGTFTVQVGVADTARDVAGNVAPTSAVSAAITLDNVLPTVVISTTAPATTANATIPVRLVFSEIVTGLIGTDLILVNAMIATAPLSTDGGITWNGTITATATGAVQVGLAATTVADVAGNGNAMVAATTLTTYDTTGPTVTVDQAASQTDPTSGNITFTVVFSALVDPTTFNATTDMIFGGTAGGARTATGTVDGTGLIYTVRVSGMAAPAGTVTATLPANVVLSLVGAKPNQASTSIDNSVSWTVPVSGTTPPVEEFADGQTGKSGGPCGSGSELAGLGLMAMLMFSLFGGRRQRR